MWNWGWDGMGWDGNGGGWMYGTFMIWKSVVCLCASMRPMIVEKWDISNFFSFCFFFVLQHNIVADGIMTSSDSRS